MTMPYICILDLEVCHRWVCCLKNEDYPTWLLSSVKNMLQRLTPLAQPNVVFPTL